MSFDPKHLSSEDIGNLGEQALRQASAAAFSAHLNHTAAMASLKAIADAINAAKAAKQPPAPQRSGEVNPPVPVPLGG